MLKKRNFVHIPNAYIGVPFSQLKSYLDKTSGRTAEGDSKPGIPAVDSTNNEMIEWFRAAADCFPGQKDEHSGKRR